MAVLKESIKMSWNNIINNKMRSLLTMLGIVIGVGSIIALVTIMQGATGEITSQISSLGADKITVQAKGTPLKLGLNEKDLEALSKIENVKGVSPSVSGKGSVFANRISKRDVSVQGRNEMHFKADDDLLNSGRPLNILDVENKTNTAVIGSSIAKELFTGQDPIGQSIRINGAAFTVVGTLKDSGSFSMNSTNDTVIIPYTTAMKILGTHNIMSVDVFMADNSKSETIIDGINGVLSQAFNYKEEAFSVFNMNDMLGTINSVTGMMTLLLVGIASISLIVGGIGIMNMMLVSVTERTTEIGLRKALGAEPSRIQLQFSIESIFLSLFGGIIGLVLGVATAAIGAQLIGFDFTLSISSIVLAIGFSAAVGIIFGFMPARKASRLNPIDALRHV